MSRRQPSKPEPALSAYCAGGDALAQAGASGRKRSWRVFAAAGLLASCAESGEGDTRRQLLEAWSSAFIVDGYAAFEAESDALAAELSSLCSDLSAERLEAAQGAWSQTRAPLKENEVFAFGPYSRPEFNIGPRIDTWPAQVDRVELALAGDAPLSAEGVAQLGISQKGLPVIEYLLFEPKALARLAEPKRCSYLRGLGSTLASDARELHQAWAPEGGDFAAQLSEAGRTSTAFPSLSRAFDEVVNRMGFLLVNIRADKLGRPLGEDTQGGVPAPEAAESRFSGRSVQDVLDNLRGVERLYFGEGQTPGLNRYVAERGRDFDAATRDALAAARAALEAIAGTLSEAVEQAPQSVQEASRQLRVVQDILQADVTGALGINVGFNDNDGD